MWTKRPCGPVESVCSERPSGRDRPSSQLCLPPGRASAMAGARVGVKWPPSGVQAAEPDAVLRALRGKGSPLPAQPPARRPSPGSGLEGDLDLPPGWPSGPHTSLRTRELSLSPKDLGGGQWEAQCPNPRPSLGRPGRGQQEALTPKKRNTV